MSLAIDEKYIGLVSPQLRNFNRKNGSYNFSCPICGDSKKDRKKARGYFLQGGNKTRFFCHNCQDSRSFGKFLQTVAPELYSQYVFDAFGKIIAGPVVVAQAPAATHVDETKFYQLVTPVSELPEDHIAKQYVKGRLIPEAKYPTLFFIDNFSKLKEVSEKYADRYVGEEARLLIPFYDRAKRLIGVTGRAMAESTRRYIDMKFDDKSHLIYGLDCVNFNNHIYVVEGPIDSMFLPNALAAAGSGFKHVLGVVSKTSSTIVFDNQPRNKEIIRSMMEVIEAGYSICIWEDDSEKDINDMILGGISPEEVKNIIDRNTYSDLKARLRLAQWRRI